MKASKRKSSFKQNTYSYKKVFNLYFLLLIEKTNFIFELI